MSRELVVDDHIVLRLLLDDEPDSLRPEGGRIFTTGLWYHRLCRALANPHVEGAMSRRLVGTTPAVAAAAQQSVIDLPHDIGLISLREVAWPMARLVVSGAQLNLLSLEALAAAGHVGGVLCLARADENRPLLDAAAARGIPARVIDD
jgi:hypothetical protein